MDRSPLTSFDDTLQSLELFDKAPTLDAEDERIRQLQKEILNEEELQENPQRHDESRQISLQTGEVVNSETPHVTRIEQDNDAIEPEAEENEPMSISQCVNKCHPKFCTPSQVLQACSEKKTTKIISGQFLAGYVLDSSGSLDQQRFATPASISRGSKRNSKSRPAKKQKVGSYGHHSIILADEEKLLKVWGSYNSQSSDEQVKSVRRLAAMPEKAYVCIAVETGPLELRTTLDKYRKYVEAVKEIKLQLVKTKVLSLSREPTLIPTFALSRSDAFEANLWSEVDTIVEEKDSFEINGTFAVVDLEGRHDAFLSSNGVKYLRGTLQDQMGSTRKFTVWANIPQLLHIIPETVNHDPKVVAFQRLRIRALSHSNYGSALRCPSVTSHTSFQLLNTPFNEFYRAPEQQAVSLEDLDGFE